MTTIRAAALALLCCLPLGGCNDVPPQPEAPQVKFELAKWKAGKEELWAQGHALERERLLIGKTRQQVIELLGPPVQGSPPDCVAYDIGGFHEGQPGEYLEVGLGSDGRVNHVWFGGY